jgi:hypothetical protein
MSTQCLRQIRGYHVGTRCIGMDADQYRGLRINARLTLNKISLGRLQRATRSPMTLRTSARIVNTEGISLQIKLQMEPLAFRNLGSVETVQ